MNPLLEEHELNIFKCRSVRTPMKSYDAAGIDFFIPTNLSIWDFANNTDMFLNDFINVNKNIPHVVPLKFYLISERTVGECCIRLILTWNKITEKFVVNVCLDSEIDNAFNFDVKEIEDKLVEWTLEKTTIISKIEMLDCSKICIPSGIHVNLPSNIFLKAENKSGIAAKRGLIFGASVIDVDYHGEIHISLINPTGNNVIIKADEKIIQYIPQFQPVINKVIEYEDLETLYNGVESKRGENGFGSTDKNK